MELEKCKVCSGLVARTALTCPHCGDSLRGGLQGIENLMKERHPTLYKIMEAASWVYIAIAVISTLGGAYVLIVLCSNIKNILG